MRYTAPAHSAEGAYAIGAWYQHLHKHVGICDSLTFARSALISWMQPGNISQAATYHA